MASDFSDAAKRYASIIISEVRLPDEAKTIKPVPTIAGLAGGKKYVAHQILFKFAVDSSGLFGKFATIKQKQALLNKQTLNEQTATKAPHEWQTTT